MKLFKHISWLALIFPFCVTPFVWPIYQKSNILKQTIEKPSWIADVLWPVNQTHYVCKWGSTLIDDVIWWVLVKMALVERRWVLIVLLLRAKNNQNCSFCDKSMKLPRITNLYKVNIFWYGAIPNLPPEPRYAHVKKLHIRPLHGNEAELKCLFLSFLQSSLPRFLAF